MLNSAASVWAELVDAATDVVQVVGAQVRRRRVVSLNYKENDVIRTEIGEPIESVRGSLAGVACRLSLPSHWFFCAPLNPIPVESRPFLEAFARQQIERVTPWRESDVHVSVTDQSFPEDKSRLIPILTVVPKSLVAEQIATLESNDCSSISIWSFIKGERCEIAVSSHNSQSSIRRIVSVALALLFALLPILAAFCWWQATVSRDLTDELSAQLTKMRDALVESRLPAADSVSKGGRPRIVVLLDDLSAALPDTAYLTRLRIDGDRASISGVAVNPPALVSILENTGHFSNVSFSNAITRSGAGAGKRFSLVMRIESEKAAAR